MALKLLAKLSKEGDQEEAFCVLYAILIGVTEIMENTGVVEINYLIRVPKYPCFKCCEIKSEMAKVLTHLLTIRLM